MTRSIVRATRTRTRRGRAAVSSHPRASRDIGKRTFVASLLIAIIVGGFSFLAVPRSAQGFFGLVPAAPQPTVTTQDWPARIRDFINRNRETIKAKIKVAQDVAVKTLIRTFYQQLAMQTFLYVSGQGNGQSPMFITNGNYYTNVFKAAQNDFLDKLETEYFGVVVNEPGTPFEKRALQLITRGILNPGTAAEANCSKANDLEQQDIKKIQDLIPYYRNVATASQKAQCPITREKPSSDTFIYDESSKETWLPVDCANQLDTIVNGLKQAANQRFIQCMREAGAAKRRTVRTTADLTQVVGSEGVAIAITEIFQPEENFLGTTIRIVAEAQRKGAVTAAAEEVINSQTNILPAKTLAGEILVPGSITQKYTEQGLEKATADVTTLTGSQAADFFTNALSDALIFRISKWLRSRCGSFFGIQLNPNACKTPAGSAGQSIQSQLLFGTTRQQAADVMKLQFSKTQITTGDPSRNPISTVDELESLGILDQRFRQAIDQKLTVREAVDQGLLDPDRTFGFDDVGNEPADGYPYRSLLYLRTARIIPVGWELAAKFMVHPDGKRGSYGLGELINQFNICGQDDSHKVCSSSGRSCTLDADCGAGGGTCGASPFCGLIDPNWVLKAPLTYCRKQGSGEETIAKTFICDQDTNGNGRVDCTDSLRSPLGGDIGHFEIQRQTEVCVDEPSCVSENEDGTCKAYGYCFEERPTWRFDGTLCPSYYASCQSFSNDAGQTVAYLMKTVDKNGCSSDNAGCAPYCSDRQDADQQWICTADARATNCPTGQTCTCRQPNGESCTVQGGSGTCQTPSGQTCELGRNYTYFDRNVQACSASDEGCRQYINTAPTANIVANGGFENYSGAADTDGSNGDDTVRGWGSVPGVIDSSHPRVVTTSSGVGEGNTVAVLLQAGALGEGLAFTNDRNPPGLDLGRPVASATITMSFYGKGQSSSCDGRFGIANPNDISIPGSGFKTYEDTASYTTDWQRYSRTFEIPEGTYSNDRNKQFIEPYFRAAGCSIVIDNVQVETTASTSDYKDYGSTNLLYLKSGRHSCERTDVGCEQYSPADGGDSITGVVNWPDRCAKEDVGCRAYRKEAIDHIPTRPLVDPVNLVASSGRTCQASEVGCEEYTNLDVAAQGGEAKEYYTRIQQCVKPLEGSNSQATYFTWIGDDRNGYQLKSFRLKASNLNDFNNEGAPAPCTNIKLATSADDNNPVCEDNASNVASCSAADIGTNPDCSQYFDGIGHVFYRLRSKTIPVSDECHPYRNTIDQESGTDSIYLILANQSTRCSSAGARCRAFTGNAGQNTRTIFADTFEGTSVVTNAWRGILHGTSLGTVDLSPESLVAGEHSMIAAGAFATQPEVLKDKVKSGTTYVLSFWMKPNGATKIEQASIQVGGISYPFIDPSRQLSIASEWHPYTIGPVNVATVAEGEDVRISIVAVDDNGNDAGVFVDNVSLKEITDSVFLIDGSYHSCADSELGCAAYSDRRGSPQYLKSFTRLCSPDVVGCSSLIDTQNTSSPFLSDPIRGIAMNGDVTVDYLDEPTTQCAAAAKGCSAFGQPVYDVNKKIKSFTTAYLTDDPDQHGQILCTANEVGCNEYTAGDGSKAYFRDPGAQVCEYKRYGGDQDYHWFIKGTGIRCPTVTPPQEGTPIGRSCVKRCVLGARDQLACSTNVDCIPDVGRCESQTCRGGTRDGQGCTTDANCPTEFGTCVGDEDNVGRLCTIGSAATDCTGGNICDLWTGICPEEQNGCNEYRDPSDPNPCRSVCQLELVGGKPQPVDDACKPTLCIGGAKSGDSCSTNADCPAKCVGGTSPEKYCLDDRDCSGGGSCNNPSTGSGQCSGEGIPGCRSYTYLKQTVEQNAAECNGRVNVGEGCRPFNDTLNPTLNFRGF